MRLRASRGIALQAPQLGLKALQVILAAYESFETKKVVRIQ
jgi:hypothetical protein